MISRMITVLICAVFDSIGTVKNSDSWQGEYSSMDAKSKQGVQWLLKSLIQSSLLKKLV